MRVWHRTLLRKNIYSDTLLPQTTYFKQMVEFWKFCITAMRISTKVVVEDLRLLRPMTLPKKFTAIGSYWKRPLTEGELLNHGQADFDHNPIGWFMFPTPNNISQKMYCDPFWLETTPKGGWDYVHFISHSR